MIPEKKVTGRLHMIFPNESGMRRKSSDSNLIMDTTINNLPAGIVVKEINNDFRYLYRNRESYNRDLCVGESFGKNDFDYYPPIVADKKRQEDIQSGNHRKGIALDDRREG